MTKLYSDEVELYDVAFDWDVGEEVDWLLRQLGPACASVLEPGCGSGRMLEAFARRGVTVVGFDVSPAMVTAARDRLRAAGVPGDVFLADMRDFRLGRRFGGAVCPVATLTLLSTDGAVRHLDAMAAHLEPGARYLVQIPLRDEADASAALEQGSQWEAERGALKLRVTWTTERVDLERGTEVQRSRIEILAGPRAGDVLEEEHVVTTWTPASWDALLARTPFVREATHDGATNDLRAVSADATGLLLWHTLVPA